MPEKFYYPLLYKALGKTGDFFLSNLITFNQIYTKVGHILPTHIVG